MTVYAFATMTQDEANRFSVEVDVVRFTIPAASVVVTDTGVGFFVEAQGRILNFPFSPERLAYDNFEFADGSQFLVGDADIQTTADARGNAINGTPYADQVLGRGGDDLIAGYGGSDLIFADQGNDYVRGTAGRDTVYGGPGNDQLDYTASADGVLAYGDLDNDIIVGGGGADSLYGGQGIDTLQGGGGADVLSGDADRDILQGGADNDTLLGGDGDDELSGGEGDDLILGNRSQDVIVYRAADGPAGLDTVFGGQGFDRINYAESSTSLVAFGNLDGDFLGGSQAADQLYGGRGSDTIWGNAGDDGLFGDNDIDYLFGGAGSDVVDGGEGNDLIYGLLPGVASQEREDVGSDLVFGGQGNDNISYYSAIAAQFISGGTDNDTIGGGFGNDLIYGNQDNDNLSGREGADTLYGGQGQDQLYASDGSSGTTFLSGDRDGDRIYLGISNPNDPNAGVQNAGMRQEVRIAAGDSNFVRGSSMDESAADQVFSFTTGRDVIVTGIAANAANFRSAQATSYTEASSTADQLLAQGATYAYVRVFSQDPRDVVTFGYLFWDTNGDRQIDSVLRNSGDDITAASIV